VVGQFKYEGGKQNHAKIQLLPFNPGFLVKSLASYRPVPLVLVFPITYAELRDSGRRTNHGSLSGPRHFSVQPMGPG
jgi:hypothetical protein